MLKGKLYFDLELNCYVVHNWCLELSFYLVLDEEEKVSSYITDFLKDNVNGNAMVLVNTSKLLCEYPRCIPKGTDRIRFCEVVITSIASLPTPKAQGAQISQFLVQVSLCLNNVIGLIYFKCSHK